MILSLSHWILVGDGAHDVMECQLGSLAESLMPHVLVRALNHSSMVTHIRLKQHLTLFQ